MKLRISHVTQYQYGEQATDSVNEIRLTPVTNERQSCYRHNITVEPNAPLFSYEDYFGNRVHAFSVNFPHTSLTIRTQMTVVTKEPGSLVDLAITKGLTPDEGWERLAEEEIQDRFAEYLLDTDYTRVTNEIAEFASMIKEKSTSSGTERALGVYGWLDSLSRLIREEFVFDPKATNVHTKASDMFADRRGVCQDFAHLMIAVCRYCSIPARYVSGYNFVGDLQGNSTDFQQASHAWVEAYVPSVGWCGFDPTSGSPIGERYVKLGHGRDYNDIVPVKGVYRGNGNQTLEVTVDVAKVDQ